MQSNHKYHHKKSKHHQHLRHQSSFFKSNNEEQLSTPSIGIMTLPSHQPGYPMYKYQYIVKQNIQFIEQAGGKAIPIPFNCTEETLQGIFKGLNGLYFPGGAIDIDIDKPINYTHHDYNIYTKNAQNLINLATQENDQGNYFPVWGGCQGLQEMAYIQSDLNHTVLHEIKNNINKNRKIELLSDYQDSKLFSFIDNDLEQYAEKNDISFFYHKYAIVQSDFLANKKLNDFYKITSISSNATTVDKGEQFVASFEAYNYPFYAVQFHPEYVLNSVTFKVSKKPQSMDLAKQYQNFFISEARKNENKLSNIDPELLSKISLDNFSLETLEGRQLNKIYFAKNYQFRDI